VFFRTKSEKTKDKAIKRAKGAGGTAAAAGGKAGDSIRLGASSLLHSVSAAVSPRAEAVADSARERTAEARGRAAKGSAEARDRASKARDRAMTGLDKGVDKAVPKAQEGVAGVGPKVDQARDAIVDDLLPRIQEMIGSVQSAKDDLLSRQDGPVAVVTGSPKKPARKGGFLMTLGLLAAVGAAVAYFLSQKSKSDDTDPWAGSSDRPIGGAPGVDTQVRQTVGSTQEPPLAQDQPRTDTGGATASVGAPSSGTTTGDTVSQGAPLVETTGPDRASESAPAVDPVAASAPSEQDPEIRMIDVDDMDDVPGTDPDARDNEDDDRPPA